MDIAGKVVVVTGGASGLGAALARAFVQHQAAGLVVADIDAAGARAVAAALGATAMTVDVGDEKQVADLVRRAEEQFGRIDIFVSNAGMSGGRASPFTPDDVWQRLWQVNVMSNVYAARYALPGMLARQQGYLICTASSNGITTSTSDIVYAATKHAQVAIAEWIAMVYGTRGIRSSAICPRWMWTGMTEASRGDPNLPEWLRMAQVGGITADEAAAIVVAGVREERFLITTGDDTLRDFRMKAADFDAWIRQLQHWHDEMQPDVGDVPGT